MLPVFQGERTFVKLIYFNAININKNVKCECLIKANILVWHYHIEIIV